MLDGDFVILDNLFQGNRDICKQRDTLVDLVVSSQNS